MRVLAWLAAGFAVSPTSLREPFPPTCGTPPAGNSFPGEAGDAGDYLHHIISVRGGGSVAGIYYAASSGEFDADATEGRMLSHANPSDYVNTSVVTTYERFDRSWRMSWTGCSWAFSRAFVTVDSTCVDDDVAAALLFVEEDVDDPCSHGAATGYCTLSFFKAACPASCEADEKTCHGDNSLAAAELSTALELEGAPLSCALLDCNELTIKAVCRRTCNHASHLTKEHMATPVPLPHFEATYPEARRLLRRGAAFGRDEYLDRRLAKVDDHNISYRRVFALHSKASIQSALDVFFDHVQVDYKESKFPDFAYNCNEEVEDGEPFLFCDPETVMDEVKGAGIEWTCNKREGFGTQSYTYCPWVNIDVPSVSALVAESCYANPMRSGFEDDGTDSNALCAPRETCEKLCLGLEECIGIDLVIGQDRCFLNRNHAEFCSEDEVFNHDGATLTPPTGWYHAAGFGLMPGMRYPDGHVPSRARRLAQQNQRRLVGESLWSSSSHHFLRRYADQDMVWDTESDVYCRGNNINITEVNAERSLDLNLTNILCSAGWRTADSDDLELSADDTQDFAVCGQTREQCEMLCASLTDCVGFDMHKTKRRCWLNKAHCGAERMKDAMDHDLVTKVFADACEVEITDAGPVSGVYVQKRTGPGMYHTRLFERSSGYILHAGLNIMNPNSTEDDYIFGDHPLGCYWTVADAETLEALHVISWDPDWPKDTTESNYCGDLALKPDGITWVGWNNGTKLLNATCGEPKGGVDVSFHCIEDEMCEPFQFCLLSSERLSFELDKFRGDEADLRQPLCKVLNATEIHEAIYNYKPKVVADMDRVEAVIDTFGHPIDEDVMNRQAAGHYLNMEMFRDSSHGSETFRIRLVSLGAELQQGVVTMVKPSRSVQELAISSMAPLGFNAFTTDIIRFERFNSTGGYIREGPIEFDMWTPETEPLTWFVWSYMRGQDGSDVRGVWAWLELEEVTMKASELHHEAGWSRVLIDQDIIDPDCSITIAAATNIDDCKAGHTCEENAKCVNKVGEQGYTCECKDGYRAQGTGHNKQCVATQWSPEKMLVRVENDEAFNMGWRVKEIELFEDATCRTPLLKGNHWEEKGAGSEGWYWSMLEDSYCEGNNYVPPGVESLLCSSKCSATAASGDCEGYRGIDENAGQALCVGKATCLEICASLASCVAADVHEFLPRCYLNADSGVSGATCEQQVRHTVPETGPGRRLFHDTGVVPPPDNAMNDINYAMKDGVASRDPSPGSDVHYELWIKQHVISVTASSSFHEHPPTLVNDRSMHSEWWSRSFRQPALSEYLDIQVTAFAPVAGVRVHQREDKSLSAYRVHLGPAGVNHVLDVPGTHVQHAESGATIEDRSRFTRSVLVHNVTVGTAPCVAVTCGSPNLFWSPSTLLQSYDEVPSACHCKQLCLRHVDEGCRSWMWHNEADTNYYTDRGHHTHKACNLHTSRLESHKSKPSTFASSGDVDLVLLGMTPAAAPAGPFSLKVYGAGFPSQSSKQRIKVVRSSCDEDPVPEVVGVSCSSPYVCHPQPVSAAGDNATWRIELLPSRFARQYRVCYCAGVCYSAGQWALVPGPLEVPAAGVTFDYEPGFPLMQLSAHSDSFVIGFSENISAVTAIPAHEHACNEEAYTANEALELFKFEKSPAENDGWEPIERFEVEIKNATYGNYTMCVNQSNIWFAVPYLHGNSNGPYLTLNPSDADAVRTAGIFRNAGSWSMRAGTTVEIEISGAEFDFGTYQHARLAVGKAGGSCGEGEYTEPAAYGLEPIEQASSATVLAFSLNVAEDAPPGKFPVCFCTDGRVGDVEPAWVKNTTESYTEWNEEHVGKAKCSYSEVAGELIVTRRVDTRKHYVLDPAEAEGGRASVEITGTDLDWRHDRIMVVNCQDTCGRAEASEYAYASDEWGGKQPVNNKDYSGELEVEEPYTVDGLYTEIEERFCRGNNIGSGTDLLTVNLCYNKCEKETCVGDACFCSGYYQGFDTAESTALCLPRVECEHLCTLLGDACWGVDMHNEYPRCFLNGPGCRDQATALTPAEGYGFDTSYKLLQKSSGAPARKLQMAHINWATSARGELVMMPGVSTTNNLRFTDLTFTSSGTFKVCFCDSESVSGGCRDAEDFLVEVGQVHVSGVHCLLTVPKLRAKECYEQYYGGLSCADSLPVAPASTPVYPRSYGTFPSP